MINKITSLHKGTYKQPDIFGYYGDFGGAYIPEMLHRNVEELKSSYIRIMYDDKLDCLHINPGAAGRQGWQKVRTIVRFVIDGSDIKDCEVIELGPLRG